MSKIALVHDQLTVYRGAERVLDVIHDMYPQAPIYTTVFHKNVFPAKYSEYDIHTSFVEKLPIIRKFHKLRAPFYPYAMESFNFNNYDLVISDGQGLAKGIITSPDTYHISYIHTVPWFLWKIKKTKGRHFSAYMGRSWDYKSAQRADILIANSETTQKRIGKFYRRDAQIIYPPVEIVSLQDYAKGITQKEGFVLFLGGLEGYKGEMELAQACTELKQKLVIIGKGKNEKALEHYSPYVELKKNVSDEQKAILLAQTSVLFNGSIEDFGINMVEALCLGTPVLALGKAGATEIVQNGATGLLIPDIQIETIKRNLQEILKMSFDKDKLIQSSLRFDKSNFVQKLQEVIPAHLLMTND